MFLRLMKPFLYVLFFCSIPPFSPASPSSSPSPCFPCRCLSEEYPSKRLRSVVFSLSLSITIMSLNFRSALFSPLLIPFTLSFTSPRTPRRRNAAFVAITPDLDLSEPPSPLPPPRPPPRLSRVRVAVSSVLPCLHPEPRNVNLREPAHFSLCSSLFPILCFQKPFTSLPPWLLHLPFRADKHATFFPKQKDPGLRHENRVWRSVVGCRQACSRVREKFFGW